jgi:RND family efflux transporter MFP subunit
LSSPHEPEPHYQPVPEPAIRRPSRRLKRFGVGGVCLAVVIIAAGLISRAAASRDVSQWTTAQSIPTVAVVLPQGGAGSNDLVLPGAVQPFYNAQIHARVSGYLRRWFTDIGTPVKAGQLLAVIDTPDLDQQLARAQADFTTAQANQNLANVTDRRWSKLLTEDAVSHQEADEKSGDLAAKTSLTNAAQAEVEQLKAEEAFKRIVAPFDGVVTARNTDIGALIAAGTPNDAPLFTVADVHRLRIYVRVPQDDSAQITPGLRATFTVPEYPTQTFSAVVITASGAVSDQSGAQLVELQTDNPGGKLKPGDYAQVTFALTTMSAGLSVPASATMFLPKGMAVATVGPNNRVVMKYVSVARDLGTRIEIASGLLPTDRVVDNPPDSLSNGDLVRIAGATAQKAGG